MGIVKGYNGSVKVGSTPTLAGEVKNFSISQSADVQETSTLGSAWATNTATLKRWTASLEANFDIGDSGLLEFMSSFSSGAALDCEFYVGGESGVGNTKYNGTLIVESMDLTNDVASIVTISISGTGSGSLTATALA